MAKNSLAMLGKAAQMLAEIITIDDAKDVMDIASAAKHYAKKHKLGKEAVDYANSIEVSAEVKLGEILTQMEKNKGGSPRLQPIDSVDKLKPPTYKELGLTLDLASEAQKLATLPAKEIEAVKKGELGKRKAIKQVKEKEKTDLRREAAQKGKSIKLSEQIDLRHGDFRKVLCGLERPVDLILTDPPYPREFLPLWEDLAIFAKANLKEHGYLIAYSGQLHLPEVFNLLQKHLDYVWTFCLYLEGKTQIVNAVNVICRWKPVLIFQKGKTKFDKTIQDYIISRQPEKGEHDWQQSLSGVSAFLENFSIPGETICDPFSGAGTTALACKKSGRLFVGAEIDKEAFEISKGRL